MMLQANTTISLGLFWLSFSVLLSAAGPAFAQKTYRCGNTYQQVPCTLSTTTSGGGTATAGKPEDKAKAATAAAPAKAAEMTAEEKKAEQAKQAKAAEAKKAEDDAKAKKARCDKLKDEMGYNAAQQKSGGSKTTMDRLAGEGKQIDADSKKEGCSA